MTQIFRTFIFSIVTKEIIPLVFEEVFELKTTLGVFSILRKVPPAVWHELANTVKIEKYCKN